MEVLVKVIIYLTKQRGGATVDSKALKYWAPSQAMDAIHLHYGYDLRRALSTHRWQALHFSQWHMAL